MRITTEKRRQAASDAAEIEQLETNRGTVAKADISLSDGVPIVPLLTLTITSSDPEWAALQSVIDAVATRKKSAAQKRVTDTGIELQTKQAVRG